MSVQTDYYIPEMKKMEATISSMAAEITQLRSVVNEIAYPIVAMQKRLKPDEKLDGVVAVTLANSADYLRSIALKALHGQAPAVIATDRTGGAT